MAIRDFYKVATLEVVKDVYGDPYYVAEIKFAQKHSINIHYGRAVHQIFGGRKIILTPELVHFVKSTVDMKQAEFDLPFSRATLAILRRTVFQNPYKSYQEWLETPDRPHYVTFAKPLNNPEYVYDYFGQKYILYDAHMTGLAVPVLKGIEEQKALHNARGHVEIILTPELAQLIIDYRLRPYDLLDQTPLQKQALKKLRVRLGFNIYTDRNAWFAERIDDLSTLTPTDFINQHSHYSEIENWSETGDTHNAISLISTVSVPIKAVLAMLENESEQDTVLLNVLE